MDTIFLGAIGHPDVKPAGILAKWAIGWPRASARTDPAQRLLGK